MSPDQEDRLESLARSYERLAEHSELVERRLAEVHSAVFGDPLDEGSVGLRDRVRTLERVAAGISKIQWILIAGVASVAFKTVVDWFPPPWSHEAREHQIPSSTSR